MSGIAGIWNTSGQPVARELLAAMSARIAHRGLDGGALWTAGPFGIAVQLTRISPESQFEVQPLVNAAGAVFAFDGRLDDREVLLSLLDPSHGVSMASADPELVAAAYCQFGEDFAARLNGEFALAVIDPRQSKVMLSRDALGFRSLYYYRAGGVVLFASEIKALLAHPEVRTAPNEDALIEVLLKGPAPSDPAATFFQNVLRVLPGQQAAFQAEGISLRQMWDFDTTKKTALKDFGEYAEAYRHYFEQAVRRRMRSVYPVAVSVSGGLDSSAIFCMAEQIRSSEPDAWPSVRGFTFTPSDGSPADETEFLEAIEKQYGVSMQRIPPAGLGPMGSARQSLWHSEDPTLDVLSDANMALNQSVQAQGGRVLLTGHWADQVLVGDSYLSDLAAQLSWRQVWRHANEYGRWFTDAEDAVRLFRAQAFVSLARTYTPRFLQPPLKRWRRRRMIGPILPPWFSMDWKKRALEPLAEREKRGGERSTAHASALYHTVRARHCQRIMELNDKAGAAMCGVRTLFPFLDRELLQFLMSIPGEMQVFGGVPKAIHREGVRGVMPDAICDRRWKADFTHQANAGMQRSFNAIVEEFKHRRMVVEMGYVDGQSLNDGLEVARGRLKENALSAWALADLTALEQWLRIFFDPAGAGTVPNREIGQAL